MLLAKNRTLMLFLWYFEGKGVEVIFHHEEILEDYLDTEFDIHFWEEEIGTGN